MCRFSLYIKLEYQTEDFDYIDKMSLVSISEGNFNISFISLIHIFMYKWNFLHVHFLLVYI